MLGADAFSRRRPSIKTLVGRAAAHESSTSCSTSSCSNPSSRAACPANATCDGTAVCRYQRVEGSGGGKGWTWARRHSCGQGGHQRGQGAREESRSPLPTPSTPACRSLNQQAKRIQSGQQRPRLSGWPKRRQKQPLETSTRRKPQQLVLLPLRRLSRLILPAQHRPTEATRPPRPTLGFRLSNRTRVAISTSQTEEVGIIPSGPSRPSPCTRQHPRLSPTMRPSDLKQARREVDPSAAQVRQGQR